MNAARRVHAGSIGAGGPFLGISGSAALPQPNHGFIGLFHWGMGFCSNGAKLELESRAAYPPTLSEQKPEIPFEPYINMVR